MIIGLTGSIATGKSTVAKMFKDLGIPVIDADKIAREVVEPGEEAYEQIIQQFGTNILFSDGTLDRKKLGSIVFQNEDKRETLNQIVHPAIQKKMDAYKNNYLQQGFKTIVLDIPLLFEGKRDRNEFDKILLVAVSEDIQLARLLERDKMGEEDARNRINSQMPIKEKIPLADAVIYNNGTLNETKEQLLRILNDWDVN
ncbi:dephospho-CoA kinase [Pueribacillus sp. YX66]|uniref:dephospho-CoA kinase n=1 Tax=Pueribacillus sp. YX66 TaxID=3229242 RepID=UPI00358D8680